MVQQRSCPFFDFFRSHVIYHKHEDQQQQQYMEHAMYFPGRQNKVSIYNLEFQRFVSFYVVHLRRDQLS